MKRGFIYLFLFIILIYLASASIQVNNITNFKSEYQRGEKISGKLDILIFSEDLNLYLTSNQGERIQLRDFLNSNKISNYCTPSNCSSDFSSSNPSTSKTLYLGSNTTYAGFVLTGKNVQVTNLNMSISSNFQRGNSTPLRIELFEDKIWEFKKFSNELTSKNYGCFNPSIPSQQIHLIGDSTSYCELIQISETNKIRVGTDVSGDNKDIKMMVYPGDGIGQIGTCTFNPTVQNYCEINAPSGSSFSAGSYQICVSALTLTNYIIKEETSSPTCGFVYSQGSLSSTKDYGIFAQASKFENSTSLKIDDSILSSSASSANRIIQNKYLGNCSNSCILPIKITGINQNLIINNIKLGYTSDGELSLGNLIYNLNEIPAKVNYEGKIDLSYTNFSVYNEGNYIIYLGTTKLLEKNISFLPAPNLTYFSPLNPTAGIPTKFYVGNQTNQKYNYEWDFGDNSTKEKTLTNNITHTYNSVGNYTVNIKITGTNYSSNISFNIEATSPRNYINSTLKIKNDSLINLTKELDSLPSWFKEAVKKEIKLDNYISDLNRLSRAYTSAGNERDYVNIAKELQNFSSPKNIIINSKSGLDLFTEEKDIDLSLLTSVSDGNTENLETEYKNAILIWQNENIKTNISTDLYSVDLENDKLKDVLRTYKIIINPSKETTYFIINKPKESIYFKNNISSIGEKSSTIIELEKDTEKTIEFYYLDLKEVSFFASPSLNSLITTPNVDESCNFNNICEDKENYKNCRSDCNPTLPIILWSIAIIIFILIVYTILQVWYKLRYENYLFGDRRNLYNLLMYIYNARSKGLTDDQIRSELRKNKWSGERINYAINKSLGKSNGLYEIIPIDWMIAKSRNKRNYNTYTTAPWQQMQGNINKYSYQGEVR